jgi:hypothetical protein
MKRKLIITASAVLLFFGSAIIISCGNQETGHEEATHEAHDHEGEAVHEHVAEYSCPMKCEGEKTYTEAGKCPSCGMDLEAVAEAHEHEGHEH